MRKFFKKIAGIVVGISSVTFLVMPVMAETSDRGTINTEATGVVEDTYIPRAKGRVFVRGFIQLTDLDGKAGIYGETLAAIDADEVGLYLYLEKYDGDSFSTYDYWKTVEYNDSMNVKGYTISVPQGYYYRLRGFHYVDADGIYENGSTMTDGLKIPQ